MTLPLPEPRENGATPDEHERISRRFIRQAHEELAKGDLIQASDKTWGAVAHALKAIAQSRGWRHKGHDHLKAIGHIIGKEFNHADILLAFSNAEELHRNFYENQEDENKIANVISVVESVLPDLYSLRHEAPRDFLIGNRLDRQQVATVTGIRGIEVGDQSPVGFSLNHPQDPPVAGGGPTEGGAE